jgi:hypothetical protein
MQDRDADGLLSKIAPIIGAKDPNSEMEAYQKLFHTIDTDGTGCCSVDELSVHSICVFRFVVAN